MIVIHRKIKIVERILVYQTLVFHVLVHLELGPNGDSAVRHVVVELKIDSEYCAVPIAIPRNNSESVQQIHVAVYHVIIAVILGAHGVTAVLHVMDLKREHVLVGFMSTAKIVIPRHVDQTVQILATPIVRYGQFGVTALLHVVAVTKLKLEIVRLFPDILLVRFQILSLAQLNLAQIVLHTAHIGHHGVAVQFHVARDTKHVTGIVQAILTRWVVHCMIKLIAL